MSQCPVCLAEVPDEFGLIECHNCGAQLLVHMDGRVEHSTSEQKSADVLEPSVRTSLRTSEPEQSMGDFLSEQAVEPEYAPPDAYDSGAPAEDVFANEHTVAPEAAEESAAQPSESEPEAEAHAEAATEETSEEPNLDFLNEPPDQAYNAPSASSSPDLSDIAQFGNSDQSGTREGVLRYNLRIDGIDTSDIRDAFREALTDRKFMWDTDSILRSIRQGQVVIPNVTASKAFMLVNRLRSLPVNIEWEQYAVTQS